MKNKISSISTTTHGVCEQSLPFTTQVQLGGLQLMTKYDNPFMMVLYKLVPTVNIIYVLYYIQYSTADKAG